MFNILVVEDDEELLELFSTVLSHNKYNPIPAKNGEEALKIIDYMHIDLIISDVMMPRINGYDLIKQLRDSKYTLPILLVTARGGLRDKEEGFRAGTDDYMVKPVDVNEMIWRIEALLRRSQAFKEKIFQIGDTILYSDSLIVSHKGLEIELPQKEFFLLLKLVASAGKIFTRIQIFNDIWGLDSETDLHTLDVHISRLRAKFRNNPDFEIVTVRGLGYKAVGRNE